MSVRPRVRVALDDANSCRLRALAALTDLELDPLSLGETAGVVVLDLCVVHEKVSPAVGRCDEAESLGAIEPFDGSVRH